MFRMRSDLPLNRDASARFLPWIIGFMVYLCALAVAAALLVDRLSDHWRQGLIGNLTVELPFAPDLGVGARAEQLDRGLDIITATPGVTGAAVLDDAQIADLLRPWLGVDAGTLDIPLPTMIAVTRHPEAPIDLPELQRRLESVAPGARVEDHGEWIDDALSFLRSLQFLAAALSALALGVAAMTVVFVTRTGLAIHRSVIEIVHVIGAPDAYIAQQFQAQSLRLGIFGGIIGVGLAAMTILGLDRVMGAGGVGGIMGSGSGAATADGGMALDFRLLPWQWAVLALLPLAVALIAMITARLTVMRTLGRLL